MYNASLLTLTKTESNKVVTARRNLYSEYVSDIKNEDTRNNVSDILFMRDSAEVDALKMAYILSKISDEDGKAEDFKNATELIIKYTGLKKSMVSNYRRVGKHLLTDLDTGDFLLVEPLQGFTVTQMLEGLQGAVLASKFIEDCTLCNITPSMSAKEIRQYYKDANAIETEATEAEVTNEAEATTETEATTEPEATTESEKLYFVDETGNKIAQIIPMNGYSIDGFIAMGTSGNLRFERG